MVFSSSIFMYVFLPAVLLLYFLVPGIMLKNIVLLGASLLFYAWGGTEYVILMISSILINYIFGIWIHYSQKNGRSGKILLVVSVIVNLGILFYFKYFNFAADTVSTILGIKLNVKDIVLPIGISFYTFQSMSYVIDVYREGIHPKEDSIVQKNPLKLAVYISMFPQLIAGPIVRYSDIHPRLSARTHTLENFTKGIEIFIIGLAKKVIFANILGGTADEMINSGLGSISVTQAWVSAFLYMLQIFYDFSGYSDMAIGLGKMFGFDFMKNFDYPYISRSITEFWRRWHISLSSWFRDYLYIPLGGNRRGNVYINLSLVFIATGIWHGADWSFVLWGVWHGLFMLIERLMRKKSMSIPVPGKIKPILGWIYTMLVVYFGWILFRFGDMDSAASYFKVIFGITKPDFIPFGLTWYMNNRTIFVMCIAILCCVPWKQFLQQYVPNCEKVWENSIFIAIKRIFLLFILVICFMLITNSTYNPFIYFRF